MSGGRPPWLDELDELVAAGRDALVRPGSDADFGLATFEVVEWARTLGIRHSPVSAVTLRAEMGGISRLPGEGVLIVSQVEADHAGAVRELAGTRRLAGMSLAPGWRIVAVARAPATPGEPSVAPLHRLFGEDEAS